MATIIKYNGVEPFKSNDIATPYVGRSTEPIREGRKLGVLDKITLEGQIDGCDEPALRAKRSAILNAFSSNFKTLEIIDDGTTILTKDFVKIDNITFAESKYIGVVEYSIEMAAADEILFNDFYGVANPSINTETSLNIGQGYSINKGISAIGINTHEDPKQSNALNNAKDFVNNFSGIENLSLPEAGLQPILVGQTEEINRLNGEYKVTEQYAADAYSLHKIGNSFPEGVLRYELKAQDSFSEIKSIGISGSINAGLDGSMANIRERLNGINFHHIAESTMGIALVKHPVTEEITEDNDKREITFGVSFNNDFNFNDCGVSRKIRYSVEEEDGFLSISVDGEVTARGPVKARWGLVEGEFYNNLKPNIYSLANEQYARYYTPTLTSFPLRDLDKDSNIKESKDMGFINFSYKYSNDDVPDDFIDLDYSVDIEKCIPQFIKSINSGGDKDMYIVQDLNYDSIATVGISLESQYKTSITKASALEKIETIIDEAVEKAENLLGCRFDDQKTRKLDVDNVSSTKNNENIDRSKEYSYYTFNHTPTMTKAP